MWGVRERAIELHTPGLMTIGASQVREALGIDDSHVACCRRAVPHQAISIAEAAYDTWLAEASKRTNAS